MSSNQIERDCTIYCKSTVHGDIITDSITKRSVSDADLCSFLNYTCHRCESVFDSTGRTALHVAASCGRLDLVRWLVSNRHADINIKDKESSYTALHRSIFYGKLDVAVELIRLGANVNDTDSDYLTPLEHAMKDGLNPRGIFGELYCWGSNNNNLLGPQQAKQSPDLLDAFHKEYPNELVEQIYISQFHSLIVTQTGRALSCGHGQGGRLGLGDELSVFLPQPIAFNPQSKGETVTCIQASISRDHSIFLCTDANIYTCGLNQYRVLGHVPAPEQCATPKAIRAITKEIQGVCASEYHSVAWGPNAIYTWGLNAGQLGVKHNDVQTPFIVGPKNISVDMFITNGSDSVLNDVASSTGAIAVCTSDGDIYVLHEYMCKKIASRQLNVVQISVIGGTLDVSLLDKKTIKEVNTELKIAALTNTGNVSLWQGSDQKLCRCIYSINRAIVMKQISINLNELLLVSDNGEAFKGFARPRKIKSSAVGKKQNQDKEQKTKKKSPFHAFLDKNDCIVVNLQKIPKIHRALSIASDSKGKDYCIIQAPPYNSYHFPHIEPSQMRRNFETLLREADEHDAIHDVVFKADGKIFPAHKFIVAKSSPYLEKLMEKQQTIVIEDVKWEIFQQILLYIYTGRCDLTDCGELKNESLRNLFNTPDNKEQMDVIEYGEKRDKTKTKQKNPVRALHELAKRFECVALQKILGDLTMDKHVIYNKSKNPAKTSTYLTFDRMESSRFYDVTVKCRDNKRLNAHKCVLAARMEYFNTMFMRWNGENTTEVSLPFSKTTVEALLEYLYTDSLSRLDSSEINHLFNVLILADQLFVTRLKEQCERLLSDILTLRNVVQILSFANVYSAVKLKYCCLKFIVDNVPALLEWKALNDLDEDLLKELSEYYFEENHRIQCRVITPYSTAVSDDTIENLALTHPVCMTEDTPVKPIVQKKRHRVHRSSDKNVSISDNDGSFDNIIQFPDEPSTPETAIARERKIDSTDRLKSIQPGRESDVPDRLKSIQPGRESDVPDRLKSILAASEAIRNEPDGDDFKSLSASFEFPELGRSSFPSHNRFSPHKSESRMKIVKMSQKQRKRQSSESKAVDTVLMPASPKNPWKIIPETAGPVQSPEFKHININDIISDERKQKENLVKLTTRSLIYTQIEDRAIVELHKFYNTENVEEELIEIERVNNIGATAVPTWIPK
ncbi:unnamed protein product [Phyllotreta striolata]|uniref:BTB domain-containing protein n=1 Tax=Phyllotreta striolata TaxID=444603 RepID=A0A9N9XPY2_PHYSR|nr:unnamed protein product [Phyllotreta striolata]